MILIVLIEGHETDLDPILLKVWMKAEETLLSDDTELAGKANMFDES